MHGLPCGALRRCGFRTSMSNTMRRAPQVVCDSDLGGDGRRREPVSSDGLCLSGPAGAAYGERTAASTIRSLCFVSGVRCGSSSTRESRQDVASERQRPSLEDYGSCSVVARRTGIFGVRVVSRTAGGPAMVSLSFARHAGAPKGQHVAQWVMRPGLELDFRVRLVARQQISHRGRRSRRSGNRT